jgi:DNA-binding transcriptional MocR family regulator
MVATRRQALLEALDTTAPGWRYVPPQDGLSVWVDLGGISSTELARLVLDHGVRITPGPRFTATGTHDRWTRLPFALPPHEPAKAIDGLVAAARQGGRARRRARLGPDSSWAV